MWFMPKIIWVSPKSNKTWGVIKMERNDFINQSSTIERSTTIIEVIIEDNWTIRNQQEKSPIKSPKYHQKS